MAWICGICDSNEIFTKDMEDLKWLKESGLILEDKGRFNTYFGYHLYVARNEEDEEDVVYLYLKETNYTLEEASRKIINTFIDLERKDLINWFRNVEEGIYWKDYCQEMDRERLLKLVVKLQLANLEYAEGELEENYYEEFDIEETVKNIAKELELKEERNEREERTLKLIRGLYK